MPTIKDVARAAGVSIATVSYVFNDVPKVGEKTRRKVLEAARELGYIPHKVASQLASRHTRTLGAIFPYVVVEESSSGQEPNYYVTEVIWGIENTAQRLGYGLLIAGWGPEYNHELPAMLRDGSVEGVLLTGGLYPTEFIRRVKDTGIPAAKVLFVRQPAAIALHPSRSPLGTFSLSSTETHTSPPPSKQNIPTYPGYALATCG